MVHQIDTRSLCGLTPDGTSSSIEVWKFVDRFGNIIRLDKEVQLLIMIWCLLGFPLPW